MSTAWADAGQFAAGLGVLAGLYAVRRLMVRKSSAHELAALLSVRTIAVVSGLSLGYTAPKDILASFEPIASILLLSTLGWCGLAVGCGLDLRVLRRHSPVMSLAESAQGVAAVSLVFLAALGVAEFPAIEAGDLLGPSALLVLAAVCVVDMPLRRSTSAPRHRTGPRHGFWQPSLAAFWAILLVATGNSLLDLAPPDRAPAAAVPVLGAFADFRAFADFVISEGAGGNRILWGLLAGALIGLLGDLVSREEFSPGGFLFVLAGLIVLGSGIAATLNIEPLWMGLCAGAWLINSTLRRLDVVHVVERGQGFIRFCLPFLAGWVVGKGLEQGFGLQPFLLTLLVILVIRPVVKVGGLKVASRLTERSAKRSVVAEARGALGLEETGLAIGISLTTLLPTGVAEAALAAVLAGQFLLDLANILIDRARSVAPKTAAAPSTS